MEDNNYFPEDRENEQPQEQLPRRIEQQETFSERPRYEYRYGDAGQPNGPGAYPPPYRSVQPANSFSVAALVMGILSLMFAFLTGIGGVFLGAAGIIFAVLSRGDERMPTQGRIGMGLSIGGMVQGVIILLIVAAVFSSGAFQRELEKELNGNGIQFDLPEDGDDYDFYRDFIEDGGYYDDLPGV